MIECENITVELSGNLLVDNVSWCAEPNKMTAIIGPNGAGKSTLLKTLLGLISPQNGLVSVKRRLLGTWQPTELASVRAYMAQATSRQLSLPVYDYLALARLHYAESQHATDHAVSLVLEQLNLEDFANKAIDRLSGGEWQRVELARTWCQLLTNGKFDGTLLILDEPGSALDISQTQKLYHNLKHYTEHGGTVVVVEHDINTAARYCDALVLLKAGKLVDSGSIDRTFSATNINRCFDVEGDMAVNPADGRLSFVL